MRTRQDELVPGLPPKFGHEVSSCIGSFRDNGGSDGLLDLVDLHTPKIFSEHATLTTFLGVHPGGLTGEISITLIR